ncbi:ABC transporter permease, partial [Vibrio parahaemolyticus]|nr:ABC transporter permease [Vibrio parahaemolyticus]
MALPNYASKVERVAYAGYLAFCGLVLFFLIAPIL